MAEDGTIETSCHGNRTAPLIPLSAWKLVQQLGPKTKVKRSKAEWYEKGRHRLGHKASKSQYETSLAQTVNCTKIFDSQTNAIQAAFYKSVS